MIYRWLYTYVSRRLTIIERPRNWDEEEEWDWQWNDKHYDELIGDSYSSDQLNCEKN